MNFPLKTEISANKARKILLDNKILKNYHVADSLILDGDECWNEKFSIEDCIIESFSATIVEFKDSVFLTNTYFKNCQFIFSYFLGGLTIENCKFDNYLDFQAGGHNKAPNMIRIVNNHFSGFVNFFDCCYEGPMYVENNNFEKGTNISSNKQLITFDIPPIIENNLGLINIESEMSDEPGK